jgi:hypothetical protein
VVDPLCDTDEVRLEDTHLAEARQIAAELAAIARSGRLLPGSIAERHTRCGRSNCACHADPPRRHGPYYHWTRKVLAKTVGRWLTAEQRDDYEEWVRNDRRAHELLRRLEELGIAAVEDDPRSRRTRSGADPVDEARSAHA